MDITLNNSRPNWAQIVLLLEKRIFSRKLNNTTFIYLLCSIMLLCLKKTPLRLGWTIRYKILLFGAKLEKNHSFALAGDFFEKLTEVNFIYFM